MYLSETCDDGNTIDADGCSSDCLIEDGWTCVRQLVGKRPITTSICSIGSSLCGNGFIDDEETCDDKNKESGDGCSSFCLIEPGFYCEDGICTTLCGDGIIAGLENCDPGEV